MGYKVAVAGATGAVGYQIFEALDEVGFPVDDIVALASARSVGKEVSFGDKTLKVKDLVTFDFEGWDIGLFSPGGSVSAIHAPRAAEAGCVVIDNTSHFRMDPDIPLIVPEVNPEALAGYTNRNIIAKDFIDGFGHIARCAEITLMQIKDNILCIQKRRFHHAFNYRTTRNTADSRDINNHR